MFKAIALAFKYWTGGRESIADDIDDARFTAKAIMQSRGLYKSFVSGETDDLHMHHKWPVQFFPFWAASTWNFIPMTDVEHLGAGVGYHPWERGIKFKPFRIIASTPAGLYFWSNFVYKKTGYFYVLFLIIAIAILA